MCSVGQVLGGIHGNAVFTDFKVKLYAWSIGFAHGGDALAAADGLALLNQYSFVVAVGTQVGLVVLDDDEIAITAQAGTDIDNFAIGGRQDGIASRATKFDVFLAAAECAYHLACNGALPCDACYSAGVAAAAGGCGTWIGGGRGICGGSWSGRGRCGCCDGIWGWGVCAGGGRRWGVTCRFNAQDLANTDIVVAQTVPLTQVVLADAVALGDVEYGVAADDGVLQGIGVNGGVGRDVGACAGGGGSGCGACAGSGCIGGSGGCWSGVGSSSGIGCIGFGTVGVAGAGACGGGGLGDDVGWGVVMAA